MHAGTVRTRIDQIEGCDTAVGAADGQRSALGVEREGAERALYGAHEADLAVAGQARRERPQGSSVEEDDVAVVPPNGKRAAVGTDRFVEEPVASLVRDPDGGWGAQKRREQVAAGRDGVVEAHAFAREQE